MARPINRKMIGIFVVLAIGILTASIVIFGSGDLFKESVEYVLYFEESVKGLTVGSPVLYRGFPVGEVTRVIILANLEGTKDQIQVFVEIYPKSVVVVKDKQVFDRWRERMSDLIASGMRAQLVPLSLITGQLAIEIDNHPDTPAVLKNFDDDYEEIPTIPSSLSKIQASLAKLDLEEINKRLLAILKSADRILTDTDLEATLSDLRDALRDARRLMQNLNGQVTPLAAAMTDAMASADKAFESIHELVGQRSPTRADLDNTLRELAGAARSLRVLADYLEQHPEALIQGKDYKRY